MSAGPETKKIPKLPRTGNRPQPILSSSIADVFREAIADGSLSPGDRLPNEAELCGHFGVSRIALREAMHVLRGQGLIESSRGRGTFIREPDPASFIRDLAYFTFTEPKSIFDLFELRLVLESHAARRAARTAASQGQELVVALARRGFEVARSGSEIQRRRLVALDVEFHLQVARAGGNLVLEQLMQHLMQIMDSVRFRSSVISGRLERSWEQHVEIAAAIERGDEERASAAMQEHLSSVRQTLDRGASRAGGSIG